jgi:RND family efflux transporter MFP subunit
VATARAAAQLAALNLRDARVTAPVAGVIETRTVQTGQYLQPGAVLATLVRRDPMLLRFQVPVADAQKMTTGQKLRFRVNSDERELEATISHVGGAADAGSRMVAVTATIELEAARPLRPGAFAEVTVPIAASVEAAVIPQTAVRPSERGFLAYVVEDDVAHERTLELGLRTADGRVEVRSGLKAGERLVIRGGEGLREGAAVRVSGGGPAVARKDGGP